MDGTWTLAVSDASDKYYDIAGKTRSEGILDFGRVAGRPGRLLRPVPENCLLLAGTALERNHKGFATENATGGPMLTSCKFRCLRLQKSGDNVFSGSTG